MGICSQRNCGCFDLSLLQLPFASWAHRSQVCWGADNMLGWERMGKKASELNITAVAQLKWNDIVRFCTQADKLLQAYAGKGLGVKAQRVKTSENFSEESNLPRRFRRYPEILQNSVKVISSIFWEIFWNIFREQFFFREVFRSFYPLRFYPLALSDYGNAAAFKTSHSRLHLEKSNFKEDGDDSRSAFTCGLRGPAAILFISRDSSDSIAKCFRACFYGASHNLIARYVAKWGIAQMCLCETKYQGEGIAPFWGSANLPEKVSRDTGYRSDSIAVSRDMGPLSLSLSAQTP